MKPIDVRRSLWTTPVLPKLMCESCNVIVSEGGDTMSNHRLSLLMRYLGVLQGLPGMLVSSQVFPFSTFLAGAVGVRGKIM